MGSGGCGLLLEDLGARDVGAPDAGLDSEILETGNKDVVGRLLPEMGKLVLGGREQSGVSHGNKWPESERKKKER
jgi:hypothetical protein